MIFKRSVKIYVICVLLLIIVCVVLWHSMKSVTLFSAHIEDNKIDSDEVRQTTDDIKKLVGEWR